MRNHCNVSLQLIFTCPIREKVAWHLEVFEKLTVVKYDKADMHTGRRNCRHGYNFVHGGSSLQSPKLPRFLLLHHIAPLSTLAHFTVNNI